MKTILVIDDDAMVRESIQDLLEAKGFQIIAAANGKAGIELAIQHHPDLILCDLQMPEADGYAVLSTLQQQPMTTTIPFIFLTARSTKTDLRQGMNLGADDYLTKPCAASDLLHAINTRLAKVDSLQSYSQKQINSLCSNIATALPHELRTPLTGILTSVEVLRNISVEPESDEILDIADSIEHSAQKLYRIIQNFLLYAKLEMAFYDPEKLKSFRSDYTSQPDIVIKSIATKIAQRVNRESDLHMTLQSAAILIPNADLEKIILELIDNALKFSLEGTPITLSSSLIENGYQIVIQDQGRGMTADQIAHLNAYMQFERNIYEQQGVGLGVAIAKRLIELHKGQFQIESIPNQQTTIKIVLPLASDETIQDSFFS